MSTPTDTPALAERLGHYYRVDDTYVMGREKVREYARAVQDHHPAHKDEAAAVALGYPGLVAPLTFTAIPAMAANRQLLETVVVGYETFVQTEQVFEQHRPIVVGDVLSTDVELTGVRRIAGRDMFTISNTFTDAAGEVVHAMHTTVVGVSGDEVDPAMTALARSIMVHDVNVLSTDGLALDYHKTVRPEGMQRIATGGAERTPGTPRFEDVAVGDVVPLYDARISRGDLVNYAGVSGDGNPIHWDEPIAKLAGLPDVIAHGMLTMGLAAGYVSAWSGDPGALTRLAVRLSSPAVVPAAGGDIEYTGKIKSLDPETRTGVLIVGAKSLGRKIFGLATATIRFS